MKLAAASSCSRSGGKLAPLFNLAAARRMQEYLHHGLEAGSPCHEGTRITGKLPVPH